MGYVGGDRHQEGRNKMAKKAIILPTSPKLPYSPGIRAGDYIFVSGQVGHLDERGDRNEGIEAQARQCFENIKKVLAAGGASLEDVVKVTVFLHDERDFTHMNDVYRNYLTGLLPARSTVIASPPMPGILIEVDCIAYAPEK
jgi:2-iminobutanoate/2-iminopropanoate deaminase